MLLIYWILRNSACGDKGDQEFKEQTVKIVWKEVLLNFSGDGHAGA
jgi:hypothetical protein